MGCAHYLQMDASCLVSSHAGFGIICQAMLLVPFALIKGAFWLLHSDSSLLYSNKSALSTYYVTDSVSTRKVRPVLLSRSHMLSGIQSHHSSQDTIVNITETVCVELSLSVMSNSLRTHRLSTEKTKYTFLKKRFFKPLWNLFLSLPLFPNPQHKHTHTEKLCQKWGTVNCQIKSYKSNLGKLGLGFRGNLNLVFILPV